MIFVLVNMKVEVHAVTIRIEKLQQDFDIGVTFNLNNLEFVKILGASTLSKANLIESCDLSHMCRIVVIQVNSNIFFWVSLYKNESFIAFPVKLFVTCQVFIAFINMKQLRSYCIIRVKFVILFI